MTLQSLQNRFSDQLCGIYRPMIDGTFNNIYNVYREFSIPPQHSNAHYQSLNGSESTPPEMGGAAHPA